MRHRANRTRLSAALFATAFIIASSYSACALSQSVQQINLTTDSNVFLASQGLSPAANVDPNLVNPWGMSFSATSPFWISNQVSGNSTLYTGSGTPFPQPTPLVVTIAGSSTGPSGPTGQVFNSTTDFDLSDDSPAVFLFANLNGTISGWNGALGTNAQVMAAGAGAQYTGLALGSSGGGNYLYAANHAGGIDVFNQNFAEVTLAGGFTDPNLPAGLTPFNVANVGGRLFVTYAQAGLDADDAPLGSGVVDIYSMDGTFLGRFASGGNLLSPWGITVAPSGFAGVGGDILIGNFSGQDGYINVFDPSGSYVGLLTMNGDPFNMPYLWALGTRTGGPGVDPSSVYFTAGIGDQQHGLFAQLLAVPEPSTWTMMIVGFGLVGMALRRRERLGPTQLT